jgi:hypothetical protein
VDQLSSYFLKNGLIIGFLQILLYLLMYFFNPALFASMWLGPIVLLVIAIHSILMTTRWKKFQGGFISFKEGFLITFMVLMVRAFLATLFTIILFNLIDPDLEQTVLENLIRNITDIMQKYSVPEAKLEETIANIESQKGQFGVQNQILGFLYSNLIAGAFAAIVALIAKRERPIFENE